MHWFGYWKKKAIYYCHQSDLHLAAFQNKCIELDSLTQHLKIINDIKNDALKRITELEAMPVAYREQYLDLNKRYIELGENFKRAKGILQTLNGFEDRYAEKLKPLSKKNWLEVIRQFYSDMFQ